jgi:hypothetical protein
MVGIICACETYNDHNGVKTMEDTLISLATGLISVLMVVMVFQICIIL